MVSCLTLFYTIANPPYSSLRSSPQPSQERFVAVALQCIVRVRQSRRKLESARKVAAENERLEQELRQERVSSALKIQCSFRSRKAKRLRRVLAGGRKGAVVMQSLWRRKVAVAEGRARASERDRILKAKADEEERVRASAAIERERTRASASVKIQTKIRSCLAQWTVREMVETRKLEEGKAVVLQTMFRQKNARAKFVRLIVLHNAAIFIQIQARIMSSKKELKQRRIMKDDVKWSNMIRIQSIARMCLARWRVNKIVERRDSVHTMQRAIRVWISKEWLKDLKFMRSIYIGKVIKVQSIWRRRAAVFWWKQWREWYEWENSCAKLIQKRWRGVSARKSLRDWREYWMAVRLQARARGIKARKRWPQIPVFFWWVRNGLHVEEVDALMAWEPTFGDTEPPQVSGFEWNVHTVSYGGETLLMTAASVGNQGLVEALISRGCEKDTFDSQGDTAAHYAFRLGFNDLGYFMVDDLGCDDTIENKLELDCYAVAGTAVEKEKRQNMYLGDGALGSNIAMEYE